MAEFCSEAHRLATRDATRVEKGSGGRAAFDVQANGPSRHLARGSRAAREARAPQHRPPPSAVGRRRGRREAWVWLGGGVHRGSHARPIIVHREQQFGLVLGVRVRR